MSADDFRTWQGVVFGRAVSTLRSVETLPSAWGFVLSDKRDPVICIIDGNAKLTDQIEGEDVADDPHRGTPSRGHNTTPLAMEKL